MRIFSTLFLASLACASSVAQAAFSCVLLSAGQAQIEAAGRMLRPPVQLDDCEAVRVAKGEVTACVTDATGRNTCRLFAAGETVTNERLNAQSSIGSVLLTVTHLLTGMNSTRPALLRDTAPPGFPYERILALNPQIRLDLTRAGLQGVTAFEFRKGSLRGPALSRQFHKYGDV